MTHTKVTGTTGPFLTELVMPGGFPHHNFPTATLSTATAQPHPMDWVIYPE